MVKAYVYLPRLCSQLVSNGDSIIRPCSLTSSLPHSFIPSHSHTLTPSRRHSLTILADVKLQQSGEVGDAWGNPHKIVLGEGELTKICQAEEFLGKSEGRERREKDGLKEEELETK